MIRTKWKGPYINTKHETENLLPEKNQKRIISISRNSQILPSFLNLTFKIHNGSKHKEILVVEEMIGHKFGEFVFTRAKFAFKKKKKKLKSYGTKN
jgi:small subunit ribosomal protein S19|uniref:Ribosomal protein S19 n=1 Tax=Phaeodactylum tricornutum TaxID=2850 RepID=F1DGP7_PHATR|nr:ribosomal protein S19 [Phaeodactylum tricornutum]ADY18525.1 ribosomal protein S19 [Phaeodactylum tricornutum]QII42430.1 ribosomal protein S19 [Phaeodactylum tricornutum]